MHRWTETALAKAVERQTGGHALLAILGLTMEEAQTVLTSGGTSPKDFTLHDSEHSFRVAERAWNLVTGSGTSSLTSPELVLLLLSCYLHDIGMTPPEKVVLAHSALLYTGESPDVVGDERERFLSWLDSNAPEWAEIAAKQRDEQHERWLKRTIGYYVRSRHNDWSEIWIESHVRNSKLALYPGWVDDLIALCRSHHDGIETLQQERFDAREVNNLGAVVNLRFLAAILRVADVLEFDPKRTPEVILRHRDIADASKVFWYKDHDIVFNAEPHLHRLRLTARTTTAVGHRAVLQTADMVDAELVLCTRLQEHGAFNVGLIGDEDKQRYKWNWRSSLSRNIAVQAQRFEYIDGSYRVAPARVLDLLAGSRLYGDPWAALREVLQNSFDACREQIAREMLIDGQSGISADPEVYRERHLVRMSIRKQGDDVILVCSDTGAGMSKSTIENGFLVSGAPQRADVQQLERQARAADVDLSRTGQFGIGTLSYFMLANKVEVSTRKALDATSGDHRAWTFTIESLDGFGS